MYDLGQVTQPLGPQFPSLLSRDRKSTSILELPRRLNKVRAWHEGSPMDKHAVVLLLCYYCRANGNICFLGTVLEAKNSQNPRQSSVDREEPRAPRKSCFHQKPT